MTQNSFTINKTIKSILSKRGYKSDEQISEFFSVNLKQLPDFSKLKDIKKSAQRIATAIDNNENIAIYGDYDVDGTTSCALLFQFFKLINVNVKLIQPSRFIEGYGIHPPAIEKALNDDVKIIITVDCGITNYEAAVYAKEKGLDLIITDHHKDACETMPPAYAIINPNRRDEDLSAPMTKLAGVGVAFALAVEIKNEIELKSDKKVPSLYPLLQYVAIGTICDMAHLNPMNLKLVRHGLHQLPKTQYAGLRAFLSREERELDFIPSEKLSFGIGPLINAKGRLDHPDLALKLIIEEDSDIAFETKNSLEITNNERKFLQAEVFAEALTQFKNELSKQDSPISICFGENWHEGVIGIVASKMVENFNRPSIIFTNSSQKGIIKASARSAGELNMFDELKNLEKYFEKFGGHKAAAGLSMKEENFELFKNEMIINISKIPEIIRTNTDFYDLEITGDLITAKLVKDLEKIEPFGMGNHKPIFKVKDLKLNSFDILKEKHVRWNFSYNNKMIKGISFFYTDKFNVPSPKEVFEKGEPVDLYCTIGINRFKGNEFIQLMVNKII